MNLISLLHATARVPDVWLTACNAWFDACDRPENCEYIVGIDQGTNSQEFFMAFTGVPFEERSFVVNRGRKCAVGAWNETALCSTGKLLITVSDDWFPPQHWDSELLKAIPNLEGEYVLDVDNQDGSFPLLPFSLLTRAYYNRLGNLFCPEYDGNMADVEFSEIARRDGVVIDARHLKFEHRDPSRGASWDQVYERQRVQGRAKGLEVYERRKQEGFVCKGVLA